MIAVIALGSNQGDRLAYLRAAVSDIESLSKTSILKKSKIFQTSPEGGVAENAFLNAVIELETDFSASELLKKMQEIEIKNKRVRNITWGDRTLDLDLIDYNGEEIQSAELNLPHPLAQQRSFVLLPWLEINPEAVLPKKGFVRDIVKSNKFLELEFYSEF